MSGYFANLVEQLRPVAGAGAIRPRPPARFEAPEPSEDIVVSPRERFGPLSTVPASEAAVAPPSTRSPTLTATNETHRTMPRASPPATSVPKPAPIPPAPVPPVEPSARRPAAPTPPVVVERQTVRVETRREIEHRATALPPKAVAADRSNARPTADSGPLAAPLEPLPPPPVVPQVTVAPAPPPVPSFVADTFTRPTAAPPPSLAPTVEVTIGTVEVRAIVAPPPAIAPRPAAREPAPPISLDRYLAGARRGGVRP